MLRERDSASLANMQNDAVKVEVHMAATKRFNMGKTKLKEEEKPSSSSDANFDSMMKTMEKLMDRLVLGATPFLPTQQETHIINLQFRLPQIQQRQRKNRNQPDPQVISPF